MNRRYLFHRTRALWLALWLIGPFSFLEAGGRQKFAFQGKVAPTLLAVAYGGDVQYFVSREFSVGGEWYAYSRTSRISGQLVGGLLGLAISGHKPNDLMMIFSGGFAIERWADTVLPTGELGTDTFLFPGIGIGLQYRWYLTRRFFVGLEGRFLYFMDAIAVQDTRGEGAGFLPGVAILIGASF